jgi:hypothetical protein
MICDAYFCFMCMHFLVSFKRALHDGVITYVGRRPRDTWGKKSIEEIYLTSCTK